MHTHIGQVDDSRESCAPSDDLDGMAGALARALAMRNNVMQHSGRLRLGSSVVCRVTCHVIFVLLLPPHLDDEDDDVGGDEEDEDEWSE